MLKHSKLQRLQQQFNVCVELKTGEFVLIKKDGSVFGSYKSINKAHKSYYGY